MKSSDIDQELFTESYCKVCSAQLISESQRVAHYEVGCSLVTLLWFVAHRRCLLQPRLLQGGISHCVPSKELHLPENSGLKRPFLLAVSYSVNDVTATLSAACLGFSSV